MHKVQKENEVGKMELNESYEILKKIYNQVDNLRDSSRISNVLLDDFDFDEDNKDELLRYDEIMKMLESLDDFRSRYTYILKKVKYEGHLVKNESGRYCLDNCHEIYFVSGQRIEFFDKEDEKWVISRVEHNDDDYYIVSNGRNVNIDGIQVRVRE